MAYSKKSVHKPLGPKSLLIVVILILALMTAGFYAISSYIKKTNPDVYNGEYVGEAKVDVSANKIPSQFPKDFPIPPSASLVSSWSNEDKNNLGVSVIWTSGEPYEAVVDFYKSQLEKNGYKILTEFNNKPSYAISFSKADMSGYVGIAQSDKTTISVTVGLTK